MAQSGKWFVPAPPPGSVLFAFPYAGVGASSYRPWPDRIGEVAVVALQPPGRENRTREPAHRSHQAFAADLHAGRLVADDTRFADLAARLPELAGYYDRMQRRVAIAAAVRAAETN